MFVSGGSSLIPGVQGAFERVFNRRVSFWDPTENLDVKIDRVDPEDLKASAAHLVVATGLAARITDR